MSWIHKIFNAVPPEERKGIELGKNPCWQISYENQKFDNLAEFFSAVNSLVPEGSILYFEGTSDTKIKEFLESKKVENPMKVAMGTIWPRPAIYHISFTSDNMNTLVETAKNIYVLAITEHFHIYKGNKIIVEWYDAFTPNSEICVNEEIPEEKIKNFCDKFSLKYEKFIPNK